MYSGLGELKIGRQKLLKCLSRLKKEEERKNRASKAQQRYSKNSEQGKAVSRGRISKSVLQEATYEIDPMSN